MALTRMARIHALPRPATLVGGLSFSEKKFRALARGRIGRDMTYRLRRAYSAAAVSARQQKIAFLNAKAGRVRRGARLWRARDMQPERL